ncbi:MAG: TlpA family protein disulfide reductase [Acidimicrobiales bacterium]
MIFGFVIAVTAACGAGTSATNDTPPAGGADSIFDTELELFDTGQPTTLADFAGAPLVVNFWASWCPSCVGEMPDFEQVHQEQGDTVTFIGIAVEDDPSSAEEIRRATGVTYVVGRDDQGRLPELLGVHGIPATAFISASSHLVELWVGPLDIDSLRAKIDEHFSTGGRSP